MSLCTFWQRYHASRVIGQIFKGNTTIAFGNHVVVVFYCEIEMRGSLKLTYNPRNPHVRELIFEQWIFNYCGKLPMMKIYSKIPIAIRFIGNTFGCKASDDIHAMVAYEGPRTI